MIETLTHPAVRLDLSRSVIPVEPMVERRIRRWTASPQGAGTADALAADLPPDLSPSRPGGEVFRKPGGAELKRVSPQTAIAQPPVVASSGQNGLAGAESSSGEPPQAPHGRQVSANLAPRPRDAGPEFQKPAAERPARGPTATQSAAPEKGAGTPIPLREAGFPAAGVEQSLRAEPPAVRANAVFPRAVVGSGWGANPVEGAANIAPREDLALEAAAALTAPVRVLFKPRPRYPEEAIDQRMQGDVLLDVEFRYSGALEVLGVRRGLGHGLNESAIEAARNIRFAPARRDGRPVDAQATLRIRFRLLQ
jgi:TonB family protein